MSIVRSFKYRPEVDGLRALAVLPVVLFHAGLGFPGGFVGVDVFFVISGYLITSLILRDLETDKFSMINFWERRIRRILPASFFVMVVTLVAGRYLLLPPDYDSLARSAIFQALFSSNIHFWQTIDYFSASAEEMPLLHTWSLAVEEQYYFIFPVLLLILFKLKKLRTAKALAFIFSIGILVSLALAMYVQPRAHVAAFYLLPTRAWELLIGSMIAVIPSEKHMQSVRRRSLLSGLGVISILLAYGLYSVETPFPGVAALLPCLGTAAFLWSSKEYNDEQSVVDRFFATRPLVFIGKLSYSLYLWHWPIFAYANYWELAPRSFASNATLIFISFICSLFTYYFIETPFRKRLFLGKRFPVFAFGFASILILLTFGITIRIWDGFKWRFSESILQIANIKDEVTVPQLELADALDGRLPLLAGSGVSGDTLVLWGDSHAKALIPAFEIIANKNELAVYCAIHSATAPLLNFESKGPYAVGKSSGAYNQSVFDWIKKNKVKHVVLAARWSGYFSASETESSQEVSKALKRTVEDLTNIGSSTYLMMEVPNHNASVPKAVIKRELYGTDIRPVIADFSDYEQTNKQLLRLIPELQKEHFHLIDPMEEFYDKNTKLFQIEREGIPLYRDSHHLSTAGAKLLVPKLEKFLFKK